MTWIRGQSAPSASLMIQKSDVWLIQQRLCCHSVKPGEAAEFGGEEPDEVQRQVQGPAPGEASFHTLVQVRS